MSGTAPPSLDSSRPYSKAFESFVQNDPDDLVGLIAYALYKNTIRERAANGQSVHVAGDRVPTTTEIKAYRGDAEKRLSAFADSVVEQAAPGLTQNSQNAAIAAAKTEIVGAINSRTSFWMAILTNIVGWLVSIGITALIAINGIPDWVFRLGRQSTPAG